MDTVVSAMRCLPASSERRTASAATKGRSTSLSVWTVGCKRGSAAGVLAESWTDVLPDLRTEDNQRITNPDFTKSEDFRPWLPVPLRFQPTTAPLRHRAKSGLVIGTPLLTGSSNFQTEPLRRERFQPEQSFVVPQCSARGPRRRFERR